MCERQAAYMWLNARFHVSHYRDKEHNHNLYLRVLLFRPKNQSMSHTNTTLSTLENGQGIAMHFLKEEGERESATQADYGVFIPDLR